MFSFAWVLLWCLVFAISDRVLKPQSISYLNSPFLFSAYFLSCAFFYSGLLGAFQEVVRIVRKNSLPLLFLCLSFVLITWGIGFYFPISNEKIFEFIKSGFLYPHMTYATGFSKLADVLFQQLLILVFHIRVQEIMGEKKKIILFFGLVFFVLHVPLVVTMGTIAFLFIIPSTIAGFIFSFFILKSDRGIFYSLATHLFFYVVLGITLRYSNWTI